MELSLPDTELCSLLSNSLENALNAVSVLDSEHKWVKFYCEAKRNKLLLEVQTPYSGQIIMRDGLPLSGREGHGYGCRSIRTITEHNRGHYSFEPENGIFTLRVALPDPK